MFSLNVAVVDNYLKEMVTRHISLVWPVPYTCAEPYHPGSGSHGQQRGWTVLLSFLGSKPRKGQMYPGIGVDVRSPNVVGRLCFFLQKHNSKTQFKHGISTNKLPDRRNLEKDTPWPFLQRCFLV